MIQLNLYDLTEARAVVDALIAFRAANPSPFPSVLATPVPTPEIARGLSRDEAQQKTDGVTPRKRRTKAEIEAAKAQSEPAPVQAAAPAPTPVQTPPPVETAAFDEPALAAPSLSFLDDEEPAKPVDKNTVKEALVALQLKLAGKYVQAGKTEKEAGEQAQNAVRLLMGKAGGVERFSMLDPAKYGAVLKAANEEAAK
jgi:hypothetical protein